MTIPKDDILPQIAEVIVVEGRDDTAAIRRAVRAVTIETHGFGISKNTWNKIDRAHKDYGIIIFTDPDHAGEEIRRKILAIKYQAMNIVVHFVMAPLRFEKMASGELSIRKEIFWFPVNTMNITT